MKSGSCTERWQVRSTCAAGRPVYKPSAVIATARVIAGACYNSHRNRSSIAVFILESILRSLIALILALYMSFITETVAVLVSRCISVGHWSSLVQHEHAHLTTNRPLMHNVDAQFTEKGYVSCPAHLRPKNNYFGSGSSANTCLSLLGFQWTEYIRTT